MRSINRISAYGRHLSWMLALVVAAAVISGCASGLTGGSLPPGDPDVLGYVLEAASVTGAQVTLTQAGEDWPPQGTPVANCTVYLYRNGGLVGTTTTDDQGLFQFGPEQTGDYEVVVDPPAGSGLQQGRQSFRHQYRVQSRLVIRLGNAPGAGSVARRT